MKISARNALHGIVARVTEGAVNSEVILTIGGASELVAVVTRHSVDELGLVPGRETIALIDSNFIILAKDSGGLRTSARNTLPGTVIDHQVGAVNDEVTLEIDEGKTLAATITSESVEALGHPRRRPAGRPDQGLAYHLGGGIGAGSIPPAATRLICEVTAVR